MFPEVSVKRYSTGPLGADPTVAVMLMEFSPLLVGATANPAGLGVGAAIRVVARQQRKEIIAT